MQHYEIRILQSAGSPTLITAEIYMTDEAAVRAGRNLASGRQFEVWRGNARIHPEVPPSQPEAPTDRPAA